MKPIIVVDNMMPTILIGHLRQLGYPAISVRSFGVAGTSDKLIWPKVEELGAILVSKDWDFVLLAENSFRGKLIHYRRGNETTDETISTMRNKLPSVLLELNTGKSIAILD